VPVHGAQVPVEVPVSVVQVPTQVPVHNLQVQVPIPVLLLLLHRFNGLFPGQPGKLVPERLNQSGFKWGKRWWGFGIQWHQLDHVQTICTSVQTDNHTNTSSLDFYRPDALPDAQPTNQQCNSTGGNYQYQYFVSLSALGYTTQSYVVVCCVLKTCSCKCKQMKHLLFATKSQLKPPVWQFLNLSVMQQLLFCAFGLLGASYTVTLTASKI